MMMWTNDDIAEVLEHLRVQGNDDARFEAKSCARTIGTSVWESVSAFANTKGGVLLLGISEDGDFSPVPGFDANHIASQFMDGMGDGNPQGARLTNPPEYDVSRCEQNGLSFLVIDIHENGIQHKPCYLTARGPQTGGYRRMDDKDLRLSPTEVFEMTHALTPSSADRMVVPEADVSDLNAEAVDRVLAEHRNSKALRGTDTRLERMTRLNMVNKVGEVRLAGLLAAGQYPQQYYPKLIIDVVAHPGAEKSAVEGPRFVDRVQCDGNMPEAIEQAVEAIAKNLRAPTFVVGVGARTDSEIPKEVLREVVANAVVHREYDAQFLGESVTVDIYPDRVEVSNPGGLWGGVTLATIGTGVSCCRNATLMQLLHQIPYDDANDVTVEGGGSGIPLVIREMKSRALGEPVFRATPDRFTVVLGRYGVEQQENRDWLDHVGVPLTRHERMALLLLKRHGDMTVPQLHVALYLDSDDIRVILHRLVQARLADEIGPDRYALAEKVDGEEPSGGRKGLTASESAILSVLSADKPLDVHEIGRRSGKGLPTTRKALSRLVKRGLVLATAPPRSRNRKYLLKR